MHDSPLLQVYITDVSADDWQKLYRFLNKTDAQLHLSLSEQVISLPDSLHILDETGHPLQLEIVLGDIKLQALISSSDAIRIRFAPDALKNVAQRKVILRLMSTLSRRLRKEVLLTLAEHEDNILCKYSLDTGWVLNPSQGKLIKSTSKLKWYIDDIKTLLKNIFK